MVLFAVSAIWVTGRVLLRDETRDLQEIAQRIGTDVERDTADGEALLGAIRDAVEEGAPPDVQVTVYDNRGGVIATGGAPGSGGSDSTGVPAGPRHYERYASGHGFTVEVSITTAGRHRSIAALALALVLTGVPLLVLVVVAGQFIAVRGLRPLEDVTHRADSASAAEGVRSLGDPVGIDEVDRLTTAFNRLLAELDDARRLERRFTADASHELRTPLTVLLGELELADSETAPDSAAAASLASARAQARRMSDLVEALLLLRQLNEEGASSSGDFETVNLADVAREVCRLQVEARPDRARDLRLSAPDELLVLGHPGLLASAIANLVDNALKFTHPGEFVDVILRTEDGEVQTVVTDHGRGVPPGDVERLFDPFFRGSEARARTQGFGLGLPLLRQVARAHRGDVTYRPVAAGGACFTLHLPAWSKPS